MNNKILAEIYLPAANCSYDVYIPRRMKLFQVLMLLSGMLTDLSSGYFTANAETVICDKETGTVLNINLSADELHLCNGSKLILM